MKCPICRSPNVYPYKEIEGVQIYQCRKCFLAFVSALTPRKSTDTIYSFTDYQKREEQFRKRYINTLSLLKKYTSGTELLEVGAGFGLLSSILAHNGYQVDALEPHTRPHYLKNTPVKIFKKSLTLFAKNVQKKYDAIILYDVFEHIDNPKETTLILKQLLKKNGIVFIQTPNYLSFMASIVKNWSWWMIEDHRFFFSKKSLALLFEKKTWKQKYFSTYEDWFDFKKNLDGNFGNNKIAKFVFFSLFVPYYFLLRHFMWAAGKGGLITTIYQKK